MSIKVCKVLVIYSSVYWIYFQVIELVGNKCIILCFSTREFSTQCLYPYYPKYLLSWLVLLLPLGNIFLHFMQRQLCPNAVKVVGCATDDTENKHCFRVRGRSEQGKGLGKRKDQLIELSNACINPKDSCKI